MNKKVLLYTVFLLSVFFLPIYVFAQTDVADTAKDTATKIIKDQAISEIGLDPINDLKSGEKILDKIIEYIRGDIPSPLMGNLLNQIYGENKFKLWTIKTHNGNAPYAANSCKRAANQYMQSGLFNARVKAHFTPWVDISWKAVKGISEGGKSIGKLIEENTKEKVEKAIKETLFGKAKQKKEEVTIPSYDSCKSVTKVVWDPENMQINVVTSGDCGCKLINVDGGKERLGAYKVNITAPVTVENVKIEEKNRFIFWKTYNIQAQYKVGQLKVQTDADCSCANDDPPPPPPPPKKEKGWIGEIIDWLFGNNDGTDKTEDGTTDEIKEENTDTEDDSEIDKEEDEIDKSNDDNTDQEQDNSEKADENTQEKDNTTGKPQKKTLKCGDLVSVDGRDNVPTFEYRKSESSDVNFSCDNSCSKNQECKVLPESVRADGDSCVYCANIESDVIPEEKVEDTSVTCEMPSRQHWYNAMIPNFKYTPIDATTAIVENAGTYCGFVTLEEFKDTAERMMRFLNGTCSEVTVGNFVYTDMRGSCSFTAYFK